MLKESGFINSHSTTYFFITKTKGEQYQKQQHQSLS